MTVQCKVCGILSKEHRRPVKFLVLREYQGTGGRFWYFCSYMHLAEWLKTQTSEFLGELLHPGEKT